MRTYKPYGSKRDYRKIEIFINGRYVRTTTWARTLKQAKEKFIEAEIYVNPSWVTAKYKGAN